jgi:predicted ArsR family transcriptional regulator
MNGLTASEMAEKLGLKLKTVKKRLEAAGLKPLTKEAVYPESALETIRNVSMGRPPKAKSEVPAAKKPAKK